MMSHLADIQSQSYNSGCLAGFVFPHRNKIHVTALHYW